MPRINVQLPTLMRIGNRFTQKLNGMLHSGVDKACAWGAARYGLAYLISGREPQSEFQIEENVPGDLLGSLGTKKIPLSIAPACIRPPVSEDVRERTIMRVITHLNDHYGWDREGIANWLEGTVMQKHGYDLSVEVEARVYPQNVLTTEDEQEEHTVVRKAAKLIPETVKAIFNGPKPSGDSLPQEPETVALDPNEPDKTAA